MSTDDIKKKILDDLQTIGYSDEKKYYMRMTSAASEECSYIVEVDAGDTIDAVVSSMLEAAEACEAIADISVELYSPDCCRPAMTKTELEDMISKQIGALNKKYEYICGVLTKSASRDAQYDYQSAVFKPREDESKDEFIKRITDHFKDAKVYDLSIDKMVPYVRK